ncbi:abhydrolase domain-containing protein [Sodiomyces alkalinus F11]|uniref:Abhydrolase domain-containing protein n=1 Tax=Sodiomyces alkalinus (strain CBS 110278 / VKM F-3762 / F11) TaxID=1314773 RepID=A0A3N2Q228_SODAK|nr:abhydrolase domain-containing protein [Sodiomyces alkalinus F11]ROT40728.1 abhydrolase domain-containing protein [Sodiomyces alkalinus F11]
MLQFQPPSLSAVINGSRLGLAAASALVTSTTTPTACSSSPASIRPLSSPEDAAAQRRSYQTATTAHKTRDMSADEKARPQRPHIAWFPLGYKDAAYQWWTSISPTLAERNVLSHIPYLREARDQHAAAAATASALDAASRPDPYGPRVWRSQMVTLSGKDRALNEYSIERVGEEVDDNLVVLHGYGAGLGFFYKNFEPLSRAPGWKLYALDMLGMGNSTRPPFRVHAKDKAGKIAEAEAWFIDSLEEWRKIRNIDRFTLVGHSLGGYLSIAYALKYPGRLKKLVLVSPAGMPEDPFAVSEAMPEPDMSTLENEFTQDQESVVHDERNRANAQVKTNKATTTTTTTTTTNGESTNGKSTNSNNAPKRPLPGWLVWLWDANVSPFSIVRFTGPLGPRFVSGWTSRRFNHLPATEAQTLHDYAFSIFRQKGSGEYALAYILAPGAFARSPMVNRIAGVGRQIVAAAAAAEREDGSGEKVSKETGVPVVMMYGENDWMDVAGGFAAQERLKEARRKALLENSDEEKRRENGSAKVVIVPKAGHHLYLDNPEAFNEMLRKEMDHTREQGMKGIV